MDILSKSYTSFTANYTTNQIRPIGRFVGDEDGSIPIQKGVSLRELEK